jgi:curved DNA-binding protein CbpA
MASEPIPDHYKALGVEKTADASTIKATYRKLVLKCHPDKVTDPALKEQKQEEFHQIQQAYEVLIDDEKRAQYEAELTLEKLRKENKAARAARDKTARFDVRTPGGAQFTATGPSRYQTEARVPSKPRDDERYYEERSRKHDTYDPSPPKYTTAPRSSREKESSSKSTRHATDRSRSDREKTRAKEVRSDRKFNSVDSDSSSDDKARYEAEYKRRSADDEAARRKAEERRTYEDNRYVGAAPTHRKMSVQEQEALRYQHKSRGQVEDEMARPSPVRTSSRDYYKSESRSSRRDPRPEPVRRSSARPTLSRRDSERTDRGIPEVVEWADDRRGSEDVGRRPPTFKHVSSSPAELARGVPQRSYTEHHRHAENSPPPSFHRSATMPSVPSNTSSRRKESTVPRPSGLREAMTPEHHSSPERDAFPSVPPPATPSGSNTTRYYYPVPGAGVQARPENIAASTPRTVFREPAHHQRSASPIGKPPIGANRPTMPDSTASYRTVRPSMPSRTESSRNISPMRSSEDRGRSGRKLYGEVGTESRRSGRQPSYSPHDVSYAPKYGPEDVRWAPRSGEERYASKPSLGRTATYVY